MKIKNITKVHYPEGKDVFCFSEPFNNECMVVGESGKEYNSYQSVNFGFLYGRSALSFKSDLEQNWTIDEIEDYIEQNKLEPVVDREGRIDKYLTVSVEIRKKFFETYPMLEPWAKSQINFAKENGYVDSILGTRRHIPLMIFADTNNPINNKEKAHYEKIAVNSPVQAFESVLMYKSMIEIDDEIEKNNLKSVIIGMVHDSIVLYVHKAEVTLMYNIIKNAMDNRSYKIPFISEIEMGQVWGFSKEITEKNLDEF